MRVVGCAHGMHAFCVRTHPLPSSGNGIGAEGAAAVCRALEKNTTLQSLNLQGECVAVFLSCFCVVFVLLVFEGGLLLFWLHLQCSFVLGLREGCGVCTWYACFLRPRSPSSVIRQRHRRRGSCCGLPSVGEEHNPAVTESCV